MNEKQNEEYKNINFSLGATAAIVTSMSLIAGLAQGNYTKTGLIASLLVFAIADNISDSLGLHIYKESEGASRRETRIFTYGNYIARLFLSATFVLIVLLFSSYLAFIVSFLWGSTLLAILSYFIAKKKNAKPSSEIIWHLTIALMVVLGSRFLGNLILKI
jgi:predicted membrane channel-forming protein YqfA (hemolysin III family)